MDGQADPLQRVHLAGADTIDAGQRLCAHQICGRRRTGSRRWFLWVFAHVLFLRSRRAGSRRQRMLRAVEGATRPLRLQVRSPFHNLALPAGGEQEGGQRRIDLFQTALPRLGTEIASGDDTGPVVIRQGLDSIQRLIERRLSS
jgi:hypothetical protein